MGYAIVCIHRDSFPNTGYTNYSGNKLNEDICHNNNF